MATRSSSRRGAERDEGELDPASPQFPDPLAGNPARDCVPNALPGTIDHAPGLVLQRTEEMCRR